MKNYIDEIVNVLNVGGVILYPTDTVWGLGCDATNKTAVQRLFKIKRRMQDKSVIVLIKDVESLKPYVENISPLFHSLLCENPMPQSVIFPQVKNLPAGVVNQNGSGAFRIPKNEFCLTLLERFKKPLVSTSANFSGEKTPCSFEEISDEIKRKVDRVVDISFEKGATHQPSQIVLIRLNGAVEILRK